MPIRAFIVSASSVCQRVSAIVFACAVGACGAAESAAAQPEQFAPPAVTPTVAPSPAVPEKSEPATKQDSAATRLPSIDELVVSYRSNAFADRCEVTIDRVSLPASPTAPASAVSPRRATALVRIGGSSANQRLRLELGDLTLASDASQVLLLSSKDGKGYVALPRRGSLLNTVKEILPPLPFLSLHLALDSEFPARFGESGPLTWTATAGTNGISYTATLPTGSIELLASGTPLRLNETIVQTNLADGQRIVRVTYTPVPHTEVDFAVDLFGREPRRSMAELNWAAAGAVTGVTTGGEGAAPVRVANITGNTTDYKPWSLADSIASRKSAGGSPTATAMLMFIAPVGIDAAVIDTDVAQAISALRAAATDLRRASIDDPARPRLAIEPIAIYDVASFEREAPRKLDAAWTQSSRGMSDGNTLRWSLSHASTIGKYAKGKSMVIVIVDADMNLLGALDPSENAESLTTRLLGVVSPTK